MGNGLTEEEAILKEILVDSTTELLINISSIIIALLSKGIITPNELNEYKDMAKSIIENEVKENIKKEISKLKGE